MSLKKIRNILTVVGALTLSTPGHAQGQVKEPPKDSAPNATTSFKPVSPTADAAAEKGKPAPGRGKLEAMRERHKKDRKAIMDEMMGKIRAAESKEDKQRIHEEYKEKMSEQNTRFKEEAMAARAEFPEEFAKEREETIKKFKADQNKAAKK